jgi:phosphatidylinositol alpha-1,6-mannosyltransferase
VTRRKLDKRPKICLVSYPLGGYGGIQSVGRLVIDILVREPELHFKVIEIESNRATRLYRYLLLWLFVLRGYRPIFMHAYLFQACPVSALLIALAHPVIWAHGIEVWGNYARRRLTAINRNPELWAVSQFTAAQLERNWPEAPVRIVHLGVSTQAKVNKRNSCQFREGMRLITVSRFDRNEQYKGHECSLRALACLKEEHISFSADFVGDGDDRPRLERLANDLGIAQQVTFHGEINQEQLANLYSEADLFLMPSQVVASETEIWGGEGFGLVYVEAALYGIPSIAGTLGGQSDFVEHGITGWKVPADVQALVDLLKHLASHPLEIEACGRRCSKLAVQSFTREAFAARLRMALCLSSSEEEC